MKNVIIVNDGMTNFHLKDITPKANQYQNHFNFISKGNINSDSLSPFRNNSIEYEDGLSYLNEYKTKNNFNNNDLLVCFYRGILNAENQGFKNLFVAGTNMTEKNPCVAIISLNYLSWDILVKENDYEFQRNSILALILCTIIGAYTSLSAHRETYGCLMDFNADLNSFNEKIKTKFYLCAPKEKNCLQILENEPEGNKIIYLCEVFRNRFGTENLSPTKIIDDYDITEKSDIETILRHILSSDNFNEKTKKDARFYFCKLFEVKGNFTKGLISNGDYMLEYNLILNWITFESGVFG